MPSPDHFQKVRVFLRLLEEEPLNAKAVCKSSVVC